MRVFLLSECLLVLLPRLHRVSKGQNQKQDLYERHGTVAVPFLRGRNVSITQKQPPSLLCPAQATGVWRASLSSHLLPWNPHLERRWLAGMGAPVQRAPASPWDEQGTCITLVSAHSKRDYWPSIALLDLPAATRKPSQFPWEDFLFGLHCFFPMWCCGRLFERLHPCTVNSSPNQESKILHHLTLL